MANEKSTDEKKNSITPQAQQPDEKGAVTTAPSLPTTGTGDTGLNANVQPSPDLQQKQKTQTTAELASTPQYRVKHGTVNMGYELDKDGKSTGNARLLQPNDIVTGLEDKEIQRLLGLGIIEQLK